MTIFKKLVLMIVIVVITLCIIGIFQFNSISQINKSLLLTQKAAKNQHLIQIVQAQFGYGGFIHNFKNHVLRGAQKYFERFEKNKFELTKAIDQLNHSLVRKEDKKAIQIIFETAQQYMKAISISKRMHEEGKTAKEIDAVVKINDTPAFKAFIIIKEGIIIVEKQAAIGIESAQKSIKIINGIGFILVLILFALTFLLFLQILKKLNIFVEITNELTQGDLTKRFDVADKPVNKLNELDVLGFNLNKFAKSLQKNMNNISKEANSLSNSSTKMNKIAVNLSDETDKVSEKTSNTAQQTETMSNDMNAVAAAMEELSANTQQIAESTTRISETSQNIAQNADNASNISAKAVERVDSASSRVDDLGNAANKIGKVSETISDISTQTNLLALNATIEAARAGEAGKGFAVVANEIKNLASETNSATEQIRENIEWIQGSTASTIEDIKEIAKVINEVNDIVNNITIAVEKQTGTISEINTSVSEGAEAVQEVSLNIANTSVASAEVAEDVNNVNQSIDTVSSNSTSIAQSSNELSKLADELNKMVSYFKIESTTPELKTQGLARQLVSPVD